MDRQTGVRIAAVILYVVVSMGVLALVEEAARARGLSRREARNLYGQPWPLRLSDSLTLPASSALLFDLAAVGFVTAVSTCLACMLTVGRGLGRIRTGVSSTAFLGPLSLSVSP